MSKPKSMPALVGGACLLAGLFWLATTVSLAHALVSRKPDFAVKIWPNFAAAHAILAADGVGDVRSHALRAIRRSPLEEKAFRALAVEALNQRRLKRADDLLAHVEALSRRDSSAEMMLIESAVRRGDVEGALVRYKVALSVSPASKQLLFPALIQAINTTPELTSPIAEFAASETPWRNEFLFRVAGEAHSLDHILRFFGEIRRQGGMVDEQAVQVLIERLVSARRIEDARRLAMSVRPEAVGLINNGDFARRPAMAPFDWALANNRTASADIVRNGGSGELQFEYRSDNATSIARQLVALGPGNYRLETKADVNGSEEGVTDLGWNVTCTDGHKLLLQAAPAGSASFTVPAACPGQWIDLVADGSGGPDWSRGRVSSVAIRPAGRT